MLQNTEQNGRQNWNKQAVEYECYGSTMKMDTVHSSPKRL